MLVVVYTRHGCHLCDDAWKLLERAGQAYDFRLEAVDVDADPNLKSLYGDQVPVVNIDGKVRFRGRVNQVLLARVLKAEGRRRS